MKTIKLGVETPTLQLQEGSKILFKISALKQLFSYYDLEITKDCIGIVKTKAEQTNQYKITLEGENEPTCFISTCIFYWFELERNVNTKAFSSDKQNELFCGGRILYDLYEQDLVEIIENGNQENKTNN